MSAKLKNGEIIASRFKIDSFINSGGQGEVYKVLDSINKNKIFALKILKKEFLPENFARIKSEVEALEKIDSENVVSIFSTNLHSIDENFNDEPYFVMEYAQKGTLKNHDYFNNDIELSLKLFKNICEGIKKCHDLDIIHRDLKPSNILLVNHERDIKISDFGICLLNLDIDNKRATKIREKVGPMYFAPPEQTALPPLYTKKGDIYSLGRILHFMITNIYELSPYDEYKSISNYSNSDKVSDVDMFIKKMTNIEPAKRYDSIDDVLTQINNLLGEENIDQTKPQISISKIDRRILKYINSFSYDGVSFSSIIYYLEDFYNVENKNSPLPSRLDFNPFSTTQRWTDFAATVESSLHKLLKYELIEFTKGNYIISENADEYEI